MEFYNTHLAGRRAVSFCRILLLLRGTKEAIKASLGQGGSNYKAAKTYSPTYSQMYINVTAHPFVRCVGLTFKNLTNKCQSELAYQNKIVMWR